MTSDRAKQDAKRAQAGDTEALSRLVDALRAPLFAVAYRELHHYDNSHDAVTNALLRVIKYLPGLRDPAQVQAWASRIVRNEAHRLLRPPENTLPDDEDIPAGSAPLSLLRLDIERELQQLPRDQARASALFYFDGYDIAQIARELNRPEGTVKYWLHQVRGRLRDRLKDDYIMDSTNDKPNWTAVIAGHDFAPATLPEITQALHSAGWNTVQPVEDALTLSRIGRDAESPLSACQLIVLGERAGGRSAFELAAAWRASQRGKNIALFLIAEGNRPEEEFANTAMAAYVAGFDMLLSRPFNPQEFESFARRIRTDLEKSKPATTT